MNELTDNNEISEIAGLYKQTRDNIVNYKGFMQNIKSNLNSLNKILIKSA